MRLIPDSSDSESFIYNESSSGDSKREVEPTPNRRPRIIKDDGSSEEEEEEVTPVQAFLEEVVEEEVVEQSDFLQLCFGLEQVPVVLGVVVVVK